MGVKHCVCDDDLYQWAPRLAKRCPPSLTAGGLSRTLAAVAACPFTIIKTRMEYSGAGGHAYTGTLQALSSIWRTEGVRGMYAGLAPTALSQAPFSALYYLFYTRLQVRWCTREALCASSCLVMLWKHACCHLHTCYRAQPERSRCAALVCRTSSRSQNCQTWA